MGPRRGAVALTGAVLVIANLALGPAPIGADPRARDEAPVGLAATPGPAVRTHPRPGHPAPPGPDAPAPPRSARIVMSGDLLWHDTVWLSAAEDHRRTGAGDEFDFDPMFAALRPVVESADLAICHEEVPFAAAGAPYRSYPVFAAPPAVAPWIADMGWDACTTASNHALDQGFEGLVRTADLLARGGVAHVGTFRSASERRHPVVLTTDQGVRVAIVAGTYGLNGFPLPPGREWSVSMWDADNLLAQAHRARAAGADIVLVALHGGTEYDHLPNADQVALVRRLTASPDVDLVYGEHAHVVQPITRVHGKWVVYGMGNMVAQQEQTRPSTYVGITVRFTFRERPGGGFRVARASYVPTGWNHYSPGRPIRVHRLDRPGADRGPREQVVDAVDGLGHTPGLRLATRR